jgi:hypothetical protein
VSRKNGITFPNTPLFLPDIADDIDLDYVLSSILGEFYFTEYVFSGQGPGPIASQLFGLILEIRDFLRAHAAKDQPRLCKRARTILRRFDGEELRLSPLSVVQRQVEQQRGLLLEPKCDLFHKVQTHAMQRLEKENLENFKNSRHFKEMSSHISSARRNVMKRRHSHVINQLKFEEANHVEMAPWLRMSHSNPRKNLLQQTLTKQPSDKDLMIHAHAATVAAAAAAALNERKLSGSPRSHGSNPLLLQSRLSGAKPGTSPLQSPRGASPMQSPRSKSPSTSPRGGHGEESLTLKLLLNDRLGLHLFKKYCREMVAEENVLFWLEVRQLKVREITRKDETACKTTCKRHRHCYGFWHCCGFRSVGRLMSN